MGPGLKRSRDWSIFANSDVPYLAKKCILVGYGISTKGYRLYDYEKRRIFYSRDVVFNEEENGLEKEISEVNSQHNHHISIELSTDEVTEGSIDENGSINAGES